MTGWSAHISSWSEKYWFLLQVMKQVRPVYTGPLTGIVSEGDDIGTLVLTMAAEVVGGGSAVRPTNWLKTQGISFSWTQTVVNYGQQPELLITRAWHWTWLRERGSERHVRVDWFIWFVRCRTSFQLPFESLQETASRSSLLKTSTTNHLDSIRNSEWVLCHDAFPRAQPSVVSILWQPTATR